MSLIFCLLFQFFIVTKTNIIPQNEDSDNIQLEIDKEKSGEEQSQDRNMINIFGTSPAALEYNRDKTLKLKSGSELQDEIEFHARQKKDNPGAGNSIVLPEEYKVCYNNLIAKLVIGEELDSSRMVMPSNANNANSMMAQDNNRDNVAEPLFALCRSAKASTSTIAAAACLAIMTWNRGKVDPLNHPCANSITWRRFLHCTEKARFAYDEMYPLPLDQDDIMRTEPEESITQQKYLRWAAKRNANSHIPKRIAFHSWGGKRVNQVGTEKIQASRVPFNAWGGKRTVNDEENQETDEDVYEPYKKSKVKFHSWGGKRNDK